MLKFLDEKLLSDVRPSEEAFSRGVLIFNYHLVPGGNYFCSRSLSTPAYGWISPEIIGSTRFWQRSTRWLDREM